MEQSLIDFQTDFCLNSECKIIPRVFKDSVTSRKHRQCDVKSLQELQEEIKYTDQQLNQLNCQIVEQLDQQYEGLLKNFSIKLKDIFDEVKRKLQQNIEEVSNIQQIIKGVDEGDVNIILQNSENLIDQGNNIKIIKQIDFQTTNFINEIKQKIDQFILKLEIKQNKLDNQDDKSDQYQGEIKNNKKDGYGILISSNGDIYQGYFQNNLKNGHGEMKYNNGKLYKGYWKNDMWDGYGEVVFANGNKYQGNWKNDNKEGLGEYYWPDGTIYKGNYKDNLRHGYGEYFWADGRIYKGNWKDRNRDGEGEMTMINGEKYKGGWKDDKQDGYGEFIWPCGSIYKGTWKNGKKEGDGILTDKAGKFKNHHYKNGQQIY